MCHQSPTLALLRARPIAFVVQARLHGLGYVLAIADDAHLTLMDVDALLSQTA